MSVINTNTIFSVESKTQSNKCQCQLQLSHKERVLISKHKLLNLKQIYTVGSVLKAVSCIHFLFLVRVGWCFVTQHSCYQLNTTTTNTPTYFDIYLVVTEGMVNDSRGYTTSANAHTQPLMKCYKEVHITQEMTTVEAVSILLFGWSLEFLLLRTFRLQHYKPEKKEKQIICLNNNYNIFGVLVNRNKFKSKFYNCFTYLMKPDINTYFKIHSVLC